MRGAEGGSGPQRRWKERPSSPIAVMPHLGTVNNRKIEGCNTADELRACALACNTQAKKLGGNLSERPSYVAGPRAGGWGGLQIATDRRRLQMRRTVASLPKFGTSRVDIRPRLADSFFTESGLARLGFGVSDMAKHTVNLPARIFLRNHGGEALYATEEQLAPVIDKLIEVGAKTILTNVWNGGGKDATDSERLAALMKKLDSWKNGEFNVVERGESQYSAFKEVYVADCVAAGFTTKQAEEAIKAKVAELLGKDSKATFANFIEASAIEYAKAGDMTRDEAREALEAYYAKEADRRAKEREKASKKIELPKIDLAAFKK